MNEVSKVLDANEQVLWEGRPKFLPYLMGVILVCFVMALVLGPFIYLGFISASTGIQPENLRLVGIALLLLALCAIWTLVALFQYPFIHYALTNKRVILQGGIIGRDFRSVDFDQITNVEVNVDLIQKIFGGSCGSVLIYTAGTKGTTVPQPHALATIDQPYEIFKRLKQLSHDVKTDMQYPNQLRPSQNPGYTTQYDPGKKKKI